MILFEGIDKSGKTTLMRRFNEATQYHYLVLQRYFLTHLAYAKRYGRPIVLEEIMEEVPPHLMIVYCTASAKEIQARISRAHDPEIDVVQDALAFHEAILKFSHIMNAMNKQYKLIMVDTSIMSCEEALAYIIEEARQWEKDNFLRS